MQSRGLRKFSVRMGLCKQHAKDHGYHPTAEQISFQRMKNMCSFIDSTGNRCIKQAVSKKLCSMHGGKKRCKDLTDGVKCTKHVFTSGYCLLHARKHNLHIAADTKRRCIYIFTNEYGHESRCTRFSEAQGLCFIHGKKKILPPPAVQPIPPAVDCMSPEYLHQHLTEEANPVV